MAKKKPAPASVPVEAHKHPTDTRPNIPTRETAAFAEDDILLAGLAANSKTPDAYRLVEIDGMAADPYALMLRRDDPQFKALVDRALVAAFKSGAAETMYKKWFTQPIPPRGVTLNFPMSEQLRRVLRSPTDSGDPKDYR